MPDSVLIVFILAALSLLVFITWQTSRVQMARYVLAALCGACVSTTFHAAGRLFPEPPPHTCENASTGVCPCHETGVCICEPGGRSCDACKHVRPPAEEAAIHRARILEQAERAKQNNSGIGKR